MSDQSLSRRQLLGSLASLSGGMVVAGPEMSLQGFLKTADASLRVRTILKKYFQLDFPREEFFVAFTESLLEAKTHRENKKFFIEMLSNKDLEERLEVYVIEEFVVSTNYLHILAGRADELVLLPA